MDLHQFLLALRARRKACRGQCRDASVDRVPGGRIAAFHELRADGQANMDLAVMKNFPVTERVKLQFRGEMFNMTNSPQFGWPDSSVASPTFGRVTSTMNVGPRQVQFSLRASF